ncbi:MAG: nucleoside triphosphate pyrophosphohydrolase [Syntrophomonadaceae bacterium]|nr:nucleoside triphosphate pyrophosphohydrolase [Syntrophomonadaceae bacterium]
MSDDRSGMQELLDIMERLLAPDGCPWDREQTHESLIRYMVEESYEVIETIEDRQMDKMKEELGDLLLQIVFHAALAQREGHFSFDDVARLEARKMIDRHPHVFGDSRRLNSGDEVMEVWEGYKRREGRKSLLEGIPRSLPALLRAQKLQEKAARVGFDWPTAEGALDKLQEECRELLNAGSADELEDEMGDLFFALVNLARFKQVDTENALQRSNRKFIRRFDYIEQQAAAAGRALDEMTLKEMDALWDEAKALGK